MHRSVSLALFLLALCLSTGCDGKGGASKLGNASKPANGPQSGGAMAPPVPAPPAGNAK